MALRDVGPESKAESVRFHARRVTKEGREVKHSSHRRAGSVNKGTRARSGAAGRFSGAGERDGRFNVVVGEGVVEPRIKGRLARQVGAGIHAHHLRPEPEMAQDELDDNPPGR